MLQATVLGVNQNRAFLLTGGKVISVDTQGRQLAQGQSIKASVRAETSGFTLGSAVVESGSSTPASVNFAKFLSSQGLAINEMNLLGAHKLMQMKLPLDVSFFQNLARFQSFFSSGSVSEDSVHAMLMMLSRNIPIHRSVFELLEKRISMKKNWRLGLDSSLKGEHRLDILKGIPTAEQLLKNLRATLESFGALREKMLLEGKLPQKGFLEELGESGIRKISGFRENIWACELCSGFEKDGSFIFVLPYLDSEGELADLSISCERKNGSEGEDLYFLRISLEMSHLGDLGLFFTYDSLRRHLGIVISNESDENINYLQSQKEGIEALFADHLLESFSLRIVKAPVSKEDPFLLHGDIYEGVDLKA